jgi:hypothetical protein
MRVPTPLKTGKNLYDKVQPPAEVVKGLIQMGIGLGTLGVFLYQWANLRPGNSMNIADLALTVVGGGLAVSAAVELAYTLFTRGPDEALDPLILGISSFVLINISRHDPPLDIHHAISVVLAALAILLLFLARRFLPEEESGQRPVKLIRVTRGSSLVRKSRAEE